jgi:23S rRNA (pseudouridine1915-N3)-methyltransferase
MRIHILCVSKRPRDWVTQATTEYLKRLKGQLDVVVSEIAPAAKQPSKTTQLEKEAERLRRFCPRGAYTIVLDERGDQWSTSELAANLDGWRARHTDVACFIGGAEGLAPGLVAAADCRWSLSRLTLPHQFARVLLVEQLYRGWSLLHQHPYHRA